VEGWLRLEKTSGIGVVKTMPMEAKK